MIIDHIENAAAYGGLGERVRMALDYLAKTDVTELAPGRYEVDDDKVFALVQRYDTKPREKGVWEAHRRYIDLQYVASGIETMGYAPLGSLTVSKPYAPEGDCELLEGAGAFFDAAAGTFALFYPQDAHMPGLACGASQPVVKVVVKIAVA